MSFIDPVEDVIHFRTGERGHAALMYPGDIDARRQVALDAESIGIDSGGILPEP